MSNRAALVSCTAIAFVFPLEAAPAPKTLPEIESAIAANADRIKLLSCDVDARMTLQYGGYNLRYRLEYGPQGLVARSQEDSARKYVQSRDTAYYTGVKQGDVANMFLSFIKMDSKGRLFNLASQFGSGKPKSIEPCGENVCLNFEEELPGQAVPGTPPSRPKLSMSYVFSPKIGNITRITAISQGTTSETAIRYTKAEGISVPEEIIVTQSVGNTVVKLANIRVNRK